MKDKAAQGASQAGAPRHLQGWDAIEQGLRQTLAPKQPDPAQLERIEGTLHDALRPIEPSPSFRHNLRGNLTVAAQGRAAGLELEEPNPYRQGILLGILLGVLGTVVWLLWPRPSRAGR